MFANSHSFVVGKQVSGKDFRCDGLPEKSCRDTAKISSLFLFKLPYKFALASMFNSSLLPPGFIVETKDRSCSSLTGSLGTISFP